MRIRHRDYWYHDDLHWLARNAYHYYDLVRDQPEHLHAEDVGYAQSAQSFSTFNARRSLTARSALSTLGTWRSLLTINARLASATRICTTWRALWARTVRRWISNNITSF